MKMSAKAIVSKEVLVPTWVLQEMVERDWQIWEAGNAYIEDYDERSEFPEYDSTTKMLEILRNEGVTFDSKRGKWK